MEVGIGEKRRTNREKRGTDRNGEQTERNGVRIETGKQRRENRVAGNGREGWDGNCGGDGVMENVIE